MSGFGIRSSLVHQPDGKSVKQKLEEIDTQLDDIAINVRKYEDLKVVISQGYDWTPSVQAACDAAPDGASIIFPPNVTYYLNNVNHSGKTLYFIGHGAKIVQLGNSPCFNMRGGYGSILTISSITEVSYDFSGQGESHVVSKITTPSALGVVVGDVVKVVSDDEIEGARTTTTTSKRRRGEYGVVGAISGNDIYLTTLLREAYTTSPRIAKLNDVKYSFVGFKFDVLPEGDALGWNGSMITVKAAKYLTIYDVEGLKGYSSFLTLVGLYGYHIDRLRVKNLINDPTTLRYGYGINDQSCENGIVNSALFINCRHGYTTNTNSIAAGATDLENYGRSANTNVTGFAHGCSNTGFDTHDEAYGIRFNDCYANGSYRGKDASGSGYSARGRKIVFSNCIAESCRYGYMIFEQYANSTKDIVLEYCRSYNTGNYAVSAKKQGDGVQVDGLTIIGGYYEIIRGSRVFDLVNVRKGIIDGTKLVPKVGNSYARVINLDDSTVEVKNIKVDATVFTSTNLQLFRLNNISSLKADNIDVTFGSTASPRILEGDGTANKASVTNFNADVYPTVASNITDFFFGSANSDIIPNMTIFQDVTASEAIPNIANNANDVIYLRLKAIGGNWLMGAIPNGYRRGQLLVIRCSGSGANTITIRSSSTYNAILYGATNKVLANEQAITLIWDGSDWVATGQ